MSGPEPIHLRPATDLAERVVLPGDPHTALRVAQSLLESPLMFNHAHGLWGYTGLAADGAPLTVQSTGMGGPSTAIVVEELIGLGARTFVRIGTCGALVARLELGELVTVPEVVSRDGASAALGADPRSTADTGLTRALQAAGARPVTAISTDLFYDPRLAIADDWLAAGAEVVEMEAAALLTVARRRGACAAVLLAVVDRLDRGSRAHIDADALETAGRRLGETAFAALAADGREGSGGGEGPDGR